MTNKKSLMTGILIGLLGALLACLPALPAALPAQAAVHHGVWAALRTADDGQATFFLVLAAQPDLTPAARIQDWQEKGRWVFRALQEAAKSSQPALVKALRSAKLSDHVSHWQSFWIVNAVAVHGDHVALRELARLPGVAHVVPEIKLEAPVITPVSAPAAAQPRTVEWNIASINADDVWNLGYTGEGLVLANVDTGIDFRHPALVRQYRGNQGVGASGPFVHDYNWFDPFWGTTEPKALAVSPLSGGTSSHGTHVMGTALGSDGGANQIGVAPGARWIASYGCCPDNESLLAALQWMLAPTRLDGTDPNPDLRPHAVQNSWGGPGGSLIFNQAMTALKAAGVFVSASAGNNGAICGNLVSPGDNPAAFSVGASTGGNSVSGLSSRGPNPFSAVGPDLIAPGEHIRSSVAGAAYQIMSGTSMAGPHVVGAVALLWQANPALMGRVDATADLLRKTARPVFYPGEICGGVDSGAAHPNNSAGWGLLDVLLAVQVAGNGHSRLQVHVVDAAGHPLQGATVTVTKQIAGERPIALDALTDEAGYAEILIAPGPVQVSATAFGYAQATSFAIEVQDGQPTAITLPLQRLAQHTLRGLVVEQAPHALYLPLIGGGGAGKDTAPGASASHGAKRLAARISVPGAPVAPVTTDCSGAFTLTLPAGVHDVVVEANGYASRRLHIDLAGDSTQTIGLLPVWDYTVADSRSGAVPFAWVDATHGTRHQLYDDSYRPIRLSAGTPFFFYGIPYSTFYFSSNGFLAFGEPTSRFHGIIPFEGPPNNVFYGYAEDLNPEANILYSTGFDNGIYTQMLDNRLVIQFNEVEHWSHGNPETFEVILDLTTHEITVQYQQVSWPDFTTVGIEDATGQRGIAYSYANSASLQPGLAVRFTPVYGQPGQTCRP